MWIKTLAAKVLQAFNKPYWDGTIVPFQEAGSPLWMKKIGQWIAQTGRKPFMGKWLFAYVIVYILLFVLFFIKKVWKFIDWKIIGLVIVFNLMIIIPFENFTISNGYWGYPNVIFIYVDQVPWLKEINWLMSYMGAVPLSNILFVYPLAYISIVGILSIIINKRWQRNKFDDLKQPAQKLKLDKKTGKTIITNKFTLATLTVLIGSIVCFGLDVAGFRTQIGYAFVLWLMTLTWLIGLGVEHDLRAVYYGFVEKQYTNLYIKTNIIAGGLATIVETVGLYVFLVWMIYPEKTLIYYLYEKTNLEIFYKIYKFFGISSLEEYYYYIICNLLGLTSYSILHLIIRKRDLLWRWYVKN